MRVQLEGSGSGNGKLKREIQEVKNRKQKNRNSKKRPTNLQPPKKRRK